MHGIGRHGGREQRAGADPDNLSDEQSGRQKRVAGRAKDCRICSSRRRRGRLFEKFEELYPTSPLRPEVELALARTYEQENNWPAAIGIYDRWVERYTNDARLLPQVEYARAWANFQAGHETNAFQLFTNFIAQFPTKRSGARRAMVVGRPLLSRRKQLR